MANGSQIRANTNGTELWENVLCAGQVVSTIFRVMEYARHAENTTAGLTSTANYFSRTTPLNCPPSAFNLRNLSPGCRLVQPLRSNVASMMSGPHLETRELTGLSSPPKVLLSNRPSPQRHPRHLLHISVCFMYRMTPLFLMIPCYPITMVEYSELDPNEPIPVLADDEIDIADLRDAVVNAQRLAKVHFEEGVKWRDAALERAANLDLRKTKDNQAKNIERESFDSRASIDRNWCEIAHRQYSFAIQNLKAEARKCIKKYGMELTAQWFQTTPEQLALITEEHTPRFLNDPKPASNQ